jgi:CubicO group peptidase (beta-lactamase class C family)
MASVISQRRADRLFFPLIALLLVAYVLLGFWPSYIAAGLVFAKLPSALVHIHSVLYVGWIVLFATQIVLVETHHVATHRKLGIALGWWAAVMILVGPATARARRIIGGALASLLLGMGWLPVMACAPVAPAGVPDVSPANGYWGPANRWSWHNTRRVFPTAPVGRGSGPVVPLTHADRDFSAIKFVDPVSQQSMTVAERLQSTYTDGFLVLRHGEVLAESYRNGLSQEQPHLLMSVSKSVMGTLAGILVGRGQLAPGKLVTDYIPEMSGTVYEGATIRNLLDMSVEDPHARAALQSTRGSVKEYEAVDEAGGWLPATAKSAPGLRSYLMELRRAHGVNGKNFLYLDQSTILMGWVMERATGKDLAELLTQELWSKLGAEQDACILLDRHQQAYASAGFNATLRDLGRFGQMMLQNGRYNGQQIVPESWVRDIHDNGTGDSAGERSIGLAAPAPWPGHRRGTYHSFWWLTEYQGIDAIIEAVSGHGCP